MGDQERAKSCIKVDQLSYHGLLQTTYIYYILYCFYPPLFFFPFLLYFIGRMPLETLCAYAPVAPVLDLCVSTMRERNNPKNLKKSKEEEEIPTMQ